jgi:hypothetical protein
VLGLAGGFPQAFAEKSRQTSPTSSRPGGECPVRARASHGMAIEIIQRETRSTGLSLGFPIDVRRGIPIGYRSRWWPRLSANIGRRMAGSTSDCARRVG